MLLAGDERGHTQHGNNNAYCQDNELTWLSWDECPANEDLLRFTKKVIQLRKSQPVLQRRRFFHGRSIRDEHSVEIAWLDPDGKIMSEGTWNDPNVRCLGVHLSGGKIQLTWTKTHDPSPLEKNALQSLQDATQWWCEWSGRCTYQGPYREAVLQSLITLKALTYGPTGGIVAAATTSLPEHIGGVRNWDYRYCWLRDSTFTLYALLIGGYTEEARAWRKWLVNAAAGDPAQLQIMYGVAGERRLTESVLDWLPGYEGSAPVRIGNAAYNQHQLDVPGEVMETLHLARRYGLDADEDAWRVQTAVMESLETQWELPDEGIWEIRGQRQHFTHSKVMAWVAADRAVKDIEMFGMPGDAARWKRLRDNIHAEVCARGYSSRRGAFVQSYGSDETDASLLMLLLVGFIEADDPRMVGTLKFIEQQLLKDGFVVRYQTQSNVDGLPEGEGAFLLCSFWLADNYALAGKREKARQLFEMLLELRNDVGLLAEEYDPRAKRMLGNFPQAFSHVGLVNTARNLAGHGGPAEDRGHEE